jgi:SAM-dependent methyltransferase
MGEDWLQKVYRDYRQWKGWSARRRRPTDLAIYDKELAHSGVMPPAVLLEIGFGDGDFLMHAKSRGYRCVGLEISDEHVDGLRRHGIDARCGVIMDVADAQIDLIVAFDVFEHMTAAELLLVLEHANRVLRPRGRLLARFPNAASPFALPNLHGDITHRITLSGPSFVQLARVAGFERVHVGNAAWTWRGNSWQASLVKPLAILIRRGFELLLGFAYFGHRAPLDPEIVVVVQRGKSSARQTTEATA